MDSKEKEGTYILTNMKNIRSADDYSKSLTVHEAAVWSVKAYEITVVVFLECFGHCQISVAAASKQSV